MTSSPWLAAYTLLGLNDLTAKATPSEAIELVHASESGDNDESAIAAGLTRHDRSRVGRKCWDGPQSWRPE